jgi:AcrR family transcriptional regulator
MAAKRSRPIQRKPYHHGDLRNALLKAALDLVTERRSTQFSLRDLAERVGVTQPAVYRHFVDLDDVLSTLLRDGFAEFEKIEREIIATSPDHWERLRSMLRAYVHFATSNPAYFRIMYDSGLANRPENIGRARPTFQFLVDAITGIQGSRDGAFERAVAIWAAVHGLSALMLSDQLGSVLKQPERAARLEQTVTDLIERGLGGPPGLRGAKGGRPRKSATARKA